MPDKETQHRTESGEKSGTSTTVEKEDGTEETQERTESGKKDGTSTTTKKD